MPFRKFFQNKFQSSHIISVSGRNIHFNLCQTLTEINVIGQFRNLIFVWVFFIHWAQLCLPTVCCKEFKYTPASLANAPCLHEL